MEEPSNAPYGYDMVLKRDPWYRHYRFPLLPIYAFSEGDRYNTWSARISWLFFRMWTLDSFSFEAGVELDDCGLQVLVRLPYLRIVVRLIPFGFEWLRRLDRCPDRSDYLSDADNEDDELPF